MIFRQPVSVSLSRSKGFAFFSTEVRHRPCWELKRVSTAPPAFTLGEIFADASSVCPTDLRDFSGTRQALSKIRREQSSISKFRTVSETLHSLFQMHDLSSQIADRLIPQLDILSQIRDCLATLRTIDDLRSDACREYAGVQRRL